MKGKHDLIDLMRDMKGNGVSKQQVLDFINENWERYV